MALVYSHVETPTPDPRKFGIFSVADRMAASPHDLQGIEVEKENCNFGSTLAAQGICVASTRTADAGYDGVQQFDPFALYVYENCAGVNEYRLAQDRAIRRLSMGEERGVEYRLRELLRADAGAVDYSPVTPVNITRSLGLLEEAIDDNYGGVGTIHVSRHLGSRLFAARAIERRGNRMETGLGNKVSSSTNNGFYGPASVTAAAGFEWMWATGEVQYRESPAQVFDPQFIQTAGAVDEVQTLTITGSPTGGTYTLTFLGETTTAIAHNANNTTIQNALIALSNVDSGDIVVTGSSPNFTLTFGGRYDSQPVEQITATASLTGGTTPGITMGTTTQGVAGSADNTFRTLAQKYGVLSYDCMAIAIRADLA